MVRLNAVTFLILSLLLMVIVADVSVEPAKCLGFGGGSIRIQDIDHSGGIAKALFILDETTSSGFEERSTTWITVLTPRNTTYGYIIGRADPDWQLAGTNNITIWHWTLQKTYDLECSTFYPSLVFPFEQFTVTFYVSSNMTRQFSVVCEIPHFSATVAQRDVDYNETILTYQPEGLPYLKEVIVNVFHDYDYKIIALILYSLMIIIFALGFLLFKRTSAKVLGFKDYLMVSSSILVFLPVFFFAFRSSLAPSYLTVPDWLCLLSMFVYGTFLIVQVLLTKTPESEDVAHPMRFVVKGKEFDITREQIVNAVKGKQPRPIKKYYVEIDGTRYPIKQVIQLVTELYPVGFTSMYANDILSKLGFEVKSVSGKRRDKP